MTDSDICVLCEVKLGEGFTELVLKEGDDLAAIQKSRIILDFSINFKYKRMYIGHKEP